MIHVLIHVLVEDLVVEVIGLISGKKLFLLSRAGCGCIAGEGDIGRRQKVIDMHDFFSFNFNFNSGV
jgi:hypothetical protein